MREHSPYRIEFTSLSDNDLVKLSQGDLNSAAARTLFARHTPWMTQLVAARARENHLSREDCEDAKQQTWFVLQKAITRFDASQHDAAHPCSFHTFLRKVLNASLSDFVRALRRERGHLHRPPPHLEGIPAQHPHEVLTTRFETTDPADAAAWQEFVSSLDEAYQRLDETDLRRCAELQAGISERGLVRTEAQSYHTIRSWRKRLRVLLWRQLRKLL
jgi:hypothetical protein